MKRRRRARELRRRDGTRIWTGRRRRAPPNEAEALGAEEGEDTRNYVTQLRFALIPSIRHICFVPPPPFFLLSHGGKKIIASACSPACLTASLCACASPPDALTL